MRRTLFVPAFILFTLLVSASARAVVQTRVFVGLNGNDSNDCSKPATPCLSFAGAMAQVGAGGEIIVEATGGYGPLNITQSVSINSAAGVVAFSCCQVNVNVPGGTVVLRGLTIDGDGAAQNGINVVAVGVLHVESCVITGFTGNSIGAGNGLLFGSSGQLFVKDTVVRGNGWVGIWVSPSAGNAQASIDHCRLEGNRFGLAIELNAKATVRDSVASGQTTTGLLAEFGGELSIENCLAANNHFGISSATATSLVRVSNSTVTDNDTGLVNTGSLLTRSNNTVEGNLTNGTFSGPISAK